MNPNNDKYTEESDYQAAQTQYYQNQGSHFSGSAAMSSSGYDNTKASSRPARDSSKGGEMSQDGR